MFKLVSDLNHDSFQIYIETHWTRVKSIQRNITRHALHYPAGAEYGQRCSLRELGVLPLSYRREIQDILHWPILTSYQNSIVEIMEGEQATVVPFCMGKPLTRTELFMNSYFNIINDRSWNPLPVFIRTSPSLDDLRAQLVDYYKTKLTTVFQSNIL